MDLKEIKNLEKIWEDLNLIVGKEGQLCPIHQGRTFAVSKGDSVIMWNCRNPACPGHGGGNILRLKMLMGEAASEVEAAQRLLMDYGKLSEQEAARAVGSWGGQEGAGAYRAKNGKEVVSRPRGIKPPPPPDHYLDKYNVRRDAVIDEVTVGESSHTESYALAKASRRWVSAGVYNGRDWAIAVFRWDITDPEGKPDKIIRNFTRSPEGVWTLGMRTIACRPLYKLREIELNKDAIILVVEGEKCMDALQDHLDELELEGGARCIVTTSIGGSEAPERTDWSALAGRKVYIVPDCDAPGLLYAQHIAGLLPETAVELIWVHSQGAQLDDGYDVADWLRDQVRDGRHDDFWKLTRQPMSWSSTLEKIRSECDSARVDKASDLLRQILRMKYDRLIVEDLVARISKATGVSQRVLRAVMDEERNALAPRGWGDYFARKVIEEEFDGHLIREAEQWWHYDGRRWARIEFEEQILYSIDECMRRHWATEVEDWTSTAKKALFIMTSLCSNIKSRLDLMAPPPPVFNCINTELLLNPNGTVTPRKHAPDHFLMHTTECRYDPQAECPKYDQMVHTVFCGDEELIDFWHQFVGYILQPARPLKHFFMIQGSGNNGKTSIMRIISALAGNALAYMDVNGLKERFAYSTLPGKLAVVDDDVAAGSKLPDGELKKLSSGVNLTVEYKGKTPINMHIIASPILLCNRWPSLSDVTPATLERAITIPFHANIPPEKRDPTIVPTIIRSELSGVLNRAIEGYQRLQAHGRFIIPRAARELHGAWLGQSNHGVLWARTRLAPDTGSHLTARQVHDDYTEWCVEQGIRESHRYPRIALRSMLEGLSYATTNTSRRYGGWRLTDARLVTVEEEEARDLENATPAPQRRR